MTSLAEVNARLKRTNIKGKEYIDVAQRVQGFRELYPDGRIETDMVADDGKRCVCKAEIYTGKNDQHPESTGHACEVNNGRGVNATSYIENCETSAVGRALGFMGIGSTDSIASADEVRQAVRQPAQQQPDPLQQAKARLWAAVQSYAERHGGDADALAAGVKERPDAAMDDAAWVNQVAYEFETA